MVLNPKSIVCIQIVFTAFLCELNVDRLGSPRLKKTPTLKGI